MEIKNITELNEEEITEVIKIFFQTSTKQSFDSSEAKELFLFRYFGYYRENNPQDFFVAMEEVPVGYICGAQDTFSDTALMELQPQLEYFDDFKKEFPAHLHVNVGPLFHGRGIGRKLIDFYSEHLTQNKIAGVHIITSPISSNRSFYQKNGFDFKIEKRIGESRLLFMGKKLSS